MGYRFFVFFCTLCLGNLFSLSRVDTILDSLGNSSINLVVALDEVIPTGLDSISTKESVGNLSNRGARDIALGMRRLAKLDLAGRVVREGARTETNANEMGTLLGRLVQDLVGNDLGLVVSGQNAVVDLFVVLVPFALWPPGGAGATRAGVRDEEEASYGGVGGCGADKVACGVAVDLVSL